MLRNDYKIFSRGQIGNLTLPNRLVRSATWDPCILTSRKMKDEVLNVYRELALGGVGLIITGALPVADIDMLNAEAACYDDIHIEGIEKMAEVVHAAGTGCKIVTQLETSFVGAAPADSLSPYFPGNDRPLTTQEVRKVVDFFIQAIVHMQAFGFDGIQLHAAHGYFLSRFLSPYTNRRNDEYGGSVKDRARIVHEIVSGAREKVGDFPILIKMNSTDYIEGGIDSANFPELALEMQDIGLDAIEISGGMWDCLVRSEEELGFQPLPSPEAHTHIQRLEKQSYYLPYAERLNLAIPVILVGGNRNIEQLEEIVRQGKVDFIALCRPLISEPDLPRRWLEGRGSKKSECISCNSCIYAMIVHPGTPEPGLVRCIFKQDKEQYKIAQEWLSTWVEKNVTR